MEFQALHEKAQRCAEQYRRNEAELVDLLQQIDSSQAYKALGYASLHVYVVGALNLSDDQAYQFTRVARKAREVPELKAALDQGILNVSKARRILSVIEPASPGEWIAKAATLNQRDLEREVARVIPRSAVIELMKPVAHDVVEFRSAIDSQTEALLRRVQNLESRRTSKAACWNDTLAAMATLYLERHDPVRKAERAQARKPAPTLSRKAGTAPLVTYRPRSRIRSACGTAASARSRARTASAGSLVGSMCTTSRPSPGEAPACSTISPRSVRAITGISMDWRRSAKLLHALDEVVAELRFYGTRDLADLEGIGGFLERLDHLALAEAAQVASGFSRGAFGELLRQGLERLPFLDLLRHVLGLVLFVDQYMTRGDLAHGPVSTRR